MGYHDKLLSRSRTILIKGNLFIGSAENKEIVSRSVIVEHTAHGFERIRPDDNETMFRTLNGYININGGTKDLFSLHDGKLTDVPPGGCFYRAIGMDVPNDPIATVEQIRTACRNQRVGILYKGCIYRDRDDQPTKL